MVLRSTRALWKIPPENQDTRDSYERKLRRTGFHNIDLREVGALTFPGYYTEQRRPESRRELARTRGCVGGRLGQIVDVAAFKAYEMGLVDYVLVRAQKPS